MEFVVRDRAVRDHLIVRKNLDFSSRFWSRIDRRPTRGVRRSIIAVICPINPVTVKCHVDADADLFRLRQLPACHLPLKSEQCCLRSSNRRTFHPSRAPPRSVCSSFSPLSRLVTIPESADLSQATRAFFIVSDCAADRDISKFVVYNQPRNMRKLLFLPGNFLAAVSPNPPFLLGRCILK